MTISAEVKGGPKVRNVRVSKRVMTTGHRKLGSILDRHQKWAQKFASLIATGRIGSSAAPWHAAIERRLSGAKPTFD